MLNWPSSVWMSGSAIASSTSALRIVGSPTSSTRLSSTSSPVIGRSMSKRAQHALEYVEAAPHLLPVPGAVRPSELRCLDLLAHADLLAATNSSRSSPTYRATERATARWRTEPQHDVGYDGMGRAAALIEHLRDLFEAAAFQVHLGVGACHRS
jgi:hypothetical protein